jgi:hypothetical protein
VARIRHESGDDREDERDGEPESPADPESPLLRHALDPLLLRCPGRVRTDRPERRVVTKDRSLQLPQARARLDPELFAERPPRLPIRLERLCLTTAPVEGEHQLGAQALTVGMLGDEGLELGDERVVAPEREIRFDPGLERGQPEFLQPGDLGLGERLEGEVRKWSSPPQRQCLTKRRRRPLGLAARELPPAAVQESLEAADVERLWRNTQHVPRRVRDQNLFGGSIGKESPQPREIGVQDRVDCLGGSVPPEFLDQSLPPDRLVGVHEEQAEKRALFRATERECLPAPGYFERPENAELEIRTPLRRSMVRRRLCNRQRSFARGLRRV